jgi:hypothetical protein
MKMNFRKRTTLSMPIGDFEKIMLNELNCDFLNINAVFCDNVKTEIRIIDVINFTEKNQNVKIKYAYLNEYNINFVLED